MTALCAAPYAGRPVLVVDDDASIREAIKDTLEQEGYPSVEAADGTAALAYLRTHAAPPLILLDWNMAPMNGAQFMEEAAKDPNLAAIPVVLITADIRAARTAVATEKKTENKTGSGGFAGYLQKPVSLDDLFEVVVRYCG